MPDPYDNVFWGRIWGMQHLDLQLPGTSPAVSSSYLWYTDLLRCPMKHKNHSSTQSPNPFLVYLLNHQFPYQRVCSTHKILATLLYTLASYEESRAAWYFNLLNSLPRNPNVYHEKPSSGRPTVKSPMNAFTQETSLANPVRIFSVLLDPVNFSPNNPIHF